MSSMISQKIQRAGARLALASLCSGLAVFPAHAGDDGAAPIWMGLGTVIGIVKGENDVSIDYRDRGRLVLPPKLVLPPPGATAVQANPAWPIDPDVQKEKKAKLEEKKPVAIHHGRYTTPLVPPTGVVTMSATAGEGAPPAPCANPDPKTGACPQKPGAKWNYNPLTWIGLEKKPAVVLGPEPDREALTDPPKGYRAPVEGVGALADGN
jgi:hypothetical protein